MSREAAQGAQGARLRALREGARISQEHAAHEIGVSTRAYREWERGTARMKDRNLRAVARYFGTTEDYIEHGVMVRDIVPAPDSAGGADALLLALQDLRDRLDMQERVLERIQARLEELADVHGLLNDTDREILRELEAYMSRLGRDIGRGNPRSHGGQQNPQASRPHVA